MTIRPWHLGYVVFLTIGYVLLLVIFLKELR